MKIQSGKLSILHAKIVPNIKLIYWAFNWCFYYKILFVDLQSMIKRFVILKSQVKMNISVQNFQREDKFTVFGVAHFIFKVLFGVF